jgi:hypothetical protein
MELVTCARSFALPFSTLGVFAVFGADLLGAELPVVSASDPLATVLSAKTMTMEQTITKGTPFSLFICRIKI